MTDQTTAPSGVVSSTELGLSLEQCRQDGAEAGSRGQPFDVCPFQFWKANTDQQTFNEHWRPRLDAWFYGWDSTREPIRKKYNPRWHKQPNPKASG
jgi:ribosome modulation factor